MPTAATFSAKRRRPKQSTMLGLIARFAAAGLVVWALLAVLIAFVARDAGTSIPRVRLPC